VSGTNAPAARSRHAAFWTGQKVLLWGGSNQTSGVPILLAGGLYDPATNGWESTSTSTTLNQFSGYSAIAWTGNVMLVWGQSNGPTDSGTGARYDPVANAWVSIARESAPPPTGATAWIGDALLVWQNRVHRYALSPDTDHDGFTACAGDCDDSNPGVHPGSVEICNGVDDDCNNLVDESFDADADGHTSCGGDCDDADGSVWASPVEAAGLLIGPGTPTAITWESQDVVAGPGTFYDLGSGTRAGQVPIDASTAVCLSPGGSSPASDPRADPAVGEVFWYLVRGRNACGTGSYGTPARDNAIPACP
jgi:hypothetical protein